MNSGGIAGRITRPENCVLGFGIPTTPEAFLESHRYGPAGCFAQSFSTPNGNADVNAYQMEVIVPCQRLGTEIRRLGALVVPDLTLAGYNRLFHDPKTHAAIVFSHWGGDYIELQDGPASAGAIIAAIPQSFAGVVDLCVCHPEALISPLRASRPQCLIRYVSVKATPIIWLHFFRDLFHYLRRRPTSYLDASIELAAAYYGNPRGVDHEERPTANDRGVSGG
jgi:hypothetical protein